VWEGKFWLVGCLFSETRLAMSQATLSGAKVKPPHLGEGGLRAVHRICIEYPGNCLTTEEYHGKRQSG